MKLILASASPRRRELMKLITEDFTAVSSDADETLPQEIMPLEASEYLAAIKAEAIAPEYPDDIVIGCDTTVISGNKILGKPRDCAHAEQLMRELSGKTHTVVTGCAIVSGERKHSFSVYTDVTFRSLSEADILAYISTDEPYDKAGGYGIQGKGALLVEKISGDYFNVVGLPVSRLNYELNEFIKGAKS